MPSSRYLEELMRPSLGTRVLDTLLTPIGTAGKVLDTPGSVIRGLLAGESERALRGIFDTSQRVSGTELMGGAPDEFSWRGLGAEIATDPLNFLAVGKTTKAGELLKRSKNLEAAIAAERSIGAEIPSVGTRLYRNSRKLSELSDELTKMGQAGRRYTDTLAEQAATGQRSLLSFDVPFTDINVPLIKGEGAFKALGKAGEGIKAIPGIEKLSHGLNKTFNTSYNPETRKFLTINEKAMRAEHAILKREGETRAEQAVSQLYKLRDDLAKQYNLTGEQASHKLTMAIEKGELGGVPDIGKFVKPYVQITQDLFKEGVYEGIPGMQQIQSGMGYSPHYFTPAGLEFMKKRMNTLNKRKEFLRTLRTNIPGFTLQRKFMPDKAIPEINLLARQKFGIDFDIMNPDIIDNLGKRMLAQSNAIADRRLTEGYIKMFGVTNEARKQMPKVSLQRNNLVNGPALFKKLADKKKGPTLTTAFHVGDQVGKPFKFYKDKAGNVIPTTAKDTAAAVKYAKFERQLAKDSKEIERLKALANSNLRPQAMKPLTPKRELELQDKINKILERYPADLANSDPFDPYMSTKTLEEHLLGSKEWAHGTTNLSLDKILDEGFKAKKPSPQWKSSAVIPGKSAMFFGPEKVAYNFAGTASGRYPGAVEHSTRDFDEFLFDKFLKENPQHQKAVDKVTRDLVESAIKAFKANNPGITAKQLKAFQRERMKIVKPMLHSSYGRYLPPEVDKAFLIFQRKPENVRLNKKAFIKSSPRELLKLGLLHDEVGAHVDDWTAGVKTGTYLDGGDASNIQQLMAKGISKDMLERTSDNTAKLAYGTQRAWSYKDNVIRWNPKDSQAAINKLFDDADVGRYIPKEQAHNLKRMLTDVNTPDFAKSFVKVVDTVNALYRGGLTTFFPAYHVRNGLSGAFMNTLAGVKDPRAYIEAYNDLRKLSPMKEEELRGLGVLGKGQHEETRKMIEEAKLHRLGHGGTVAKAAGKSYATMQHLGQSVDNLNRYTLYKSMLKKGFTPSEAAAEVKKFHFDYADLTPTEKNVMRRAVLFYTFMRNNIPLMLKQVVENHRAVTMYNRLTGQTNANIQEPTWMLNSFFLGKDDQGDPRRFNLGLPLQDPDRFNTDGKGLQRFAQIFFSMFTPLATVPVEMTTGRSLFYDRALEGGALSRFGKASPFARFVGTAERAWDNPQTEAIRALTSVNIQSPSRKEIVRNNQISAIKNKLRGLVKEGRARELAVFSKRGPGDDKDVDALNRRLAELIRK